MSERRRGSSAQSSVAGGLRSREGSVGGPSGRTLSSSLLMSPKGLSDGWSLVNKEGDGDVSMDGCTLSSKVSEVSPPQPLAPSYGS